MSTTLFNDNSSPVTPLPDETSSPQQSNSFSSTFIASSGFQLSSSSAIASSSPSAPSSATTTSQTTPTSSYTSETGDPDSTFLGGGGESAPSSSPAANDSSESDGPPAGTVAGGVIGGIAGLAIILFLALALIKWRKKQATLKLARGSGGEQGVRGLPAGDSGPGGAGGMSETSRSVPFAIPAALASLTKPSSRESSEKGFQKVSGRKLPSVLTSGGDGYTDPRDTIMSDGTQASYRDSSAFLGNPRFAVGSPMRPESGVPVYHPGPSRTPITEQGPFSDDFAILEPPRDPPGRSQPSHDGSIRSHGSRSRFSENL